MVAESRHRRRARAGDVRHLSRGPAPAAGQRRALPNVRERLQSGPGRLGARVDGGLLPRRHHVRRPVRFGLLPPAHQRLLLGRVPRRPRTRVGVSHHATTAPRAQRLPPVPARESTRGRLAPRGARRAALRTAPGERLCGESARHTGRRAFRHVLPPRAHRVRLGRRCGTGCAGRGSRSSHNAPLPLLGAEQGDGHHAARRARAPRALPSLRARRAVATVAVDASRLDGRGRVPRLAVRVPPAAGLHAHGGVCPGVRVPPCSPWPR